MIIGFLGLITLLLIGNIFFYEMRVLKGLNSEPKFITKTYTDLQLRKRFK